MSGHTCIATELRWLTILGAYVQAGRPSMNLRHWGSFEGWSDLVRGAVVFAGLPDPGDVPVDAGGTQATLRPTPFGRSSIIGRTSNRS